METIKFKEDILPYKIIAEDDRYKICIRKLNKRKDAYMLWNQVDMNAYISFTEAYEHQKNSPIYTIVDMVEGIRGADDRIFGIYDYGDKKDAYKAISALQKGEIGISHRNRVDLNII